MASRSARVDDWLKAEIERNRRVERLLAGEG
jgi:hypothetical protein